MTTREETRAGTAVAGARMAEPDGSAGTVRGWFTRAWARLKREFVAVVEYRMSMERRQLAHRFRND